MLSASIPTLEARGREILSSLDARNLKTAILPDKAYTGGGALPDEAIPSIVLSVGGSGNTWTADKAQALRTSLPSVFCRIHDGQLLFDMRTLLGDDVKELCSLLPKVFA